MNKTLQKIFQCLIALILGTTSIETIEAASQQAELLNRGVVAVKTSNGVFVSWRFLGTDSKSTTFNLYRDGTLVNASPLTSVTNYVDANGTTTSTYTVRAVNNGIEETDCAPATVWSDIYKTLQLDIPAGGTDLSGTAYTYTPNDMSCGDLDGDGDYELIVKWDPSNSKDNSTSGYTGNVYLDAYEMDGTKLWRIDLGVNIRAGAHYTQYLVYDFDGDGKAEVVCRTAPGTIDGTGNYVLMGSDVSTADYRTSAGYILSGSEYLTVFNGETGKNMSTVAYYPARGTVNDWGDNYGNRVDRFLAGVAYLDGVHPSIIESRGYYARAGMAAYDYTDGKLTMRWSRLDTSDGTGIYGEGFHNLSIGDMDNDGYDEIVFGSTQVDQDGSIQYRTGLGHGDAQHVSKMCATCTDFYGWFCHEETSSAYGEELRNMRTGEIIFGTKTGTDNGRCLAADISSANAGFEMWSTYSGSSLYDVSGNIVSGVTVPSGVGGGLAVNFRIYWDGDLQDELLDRNLILDDGGRIVTMDNYNGSALINGTKYNPLLTADLIGDWREEFITYNSSDPSQINIFTTNISSNYRLVTPMHDIFYREGVARENVGYNQPPHLSYYIGEGIDNVSMPDIYVIKGGQAAPTLTKHGVGSSSQSVAKGDSITGFYYEWNNATTVTVTGLPESITADINTANQTISFSGIATTDGTWNYTITTVSGYDPEVTKSGTFIFGTGKTVPDTAKISLVSGENKLQAIQGIAITPIVYSYTLADSLILTGALPEGITAEDNHNGTFTISGTPHETGTYNYTLTTSSINENTTQTGTITVSENTSVSEMNIEGDLTQTIWEGDDMTPVYITYGSGTNSVYIQNKSDAIKVQTDATNRTITINGTPTENDTLTATSIGNGEVITYTIIINFISNSLKKIAYITNPSATNYKNDSRILPMLKGLEDCYVMEVDASQANYDFSHYDLVVISEIPGSSDPLMITLKDVAKPILNMKVFEYKTSETTWSWATTGYGDNYSATTVTVASDMMDHPMFKNVNFSNGNEIQMVDSVSTKALSYMNPINFTSTNGTLSNVATIKNDTNVVIFEAAAGTGISGTKLSNNFIQIGLNSSSYANVSNEGLKVIRNACYYLMGMETGSDIVNVESNSNITVYPNPIKNEAKLTLKGEKGNVQIKIINTLGEVVKSIFTCITENTEEISINRGNLPNGIYTLSVETNNNLTTRKIILY